MSKTDSAETSASQVSAQDCTQVETERLAGLLKNKAYQLLARREYSVFELQQKFKHRAPADMVDQVLNTLIQQGAQSDSRFAEMLSRSRFNAGKGPVLLKHELDKHKIDPDLIETVMAVYQQQWLESAKQVRQRKFGSAPPANFKEWAKQARFLQQRGFTSAQIGQFEAIVDVD